MLLITGPPGSGKTSFCLDRVRAYLRRGDPNWRLLVPTATMAEHVRNQLAREGYVFAPGAISTFAKFTDGLATAMPEASRAALEVATGEVLERACPREYLPVRNFVGFRRSLASAIDEFTSSGGTLADLPPQAADFDSVLSGVIGILSNRNLYLQAHRLRMLNPGDTRQEFFFAGFYSFNNPEIDFIRKLACQAIVTVSLTEWSGSESALKQLRTFAKEERRLSANPPIANRHLVSAPTLDAELTEIARRLLAEHASGRPWRDMGIIVRSEEPYVPSLRSAFDRFGIPSRFYFGMPLTEHSAIRFLTGIIEAVVAKWEHAIALEALRLTGSPLEHDDRFDYAVREQLPGSGLEKLSRLAGPEHDGFFAELDKLSAWAQAPSAPVDEWRQRYRSLTTLFHAPVIRDRILHEHAILFRSHAAAVAAWEEAVDDAAAALGSGTVSGGEFWGALRTVLDSSSLRVPDHRRDVVHVIDAFEARQWRLPVVFVCGLVEKHFPKYHSENPILGDDVRRRLQQAGIPLRTSVERQADEQFLFDLALTRATELLVLTYPILNAKADSNLPSFFIERAQPYQVAEAVDIRPAPLRSRVPEPHPGVFDDHLRTKLAQRHTIIPASAIETYLQCPYQFFAQSTLKLAKPPSDPWDRLNPPLQGSMAHKVLERVYREKRRVREVFDSVFKEFCATHRIPSGYRTEAIRLDLSHNLELLTRDDRLAPATRSLYEQDFDLAVGDVIVRGRIDRVDIDSAGRATVIDYKYSGKLTIGRTKAGHDDGTRVQGGLYLLALARLGDYTPAGMVYCGFKREVSFGGWIIRPYHVEVKAECTEDELRQVIIAAKEATLNAMASIRDGNVKPAPADETRCQFCAFSAICRVEKLAVPAVAESVMA